MKRIFTLLLLSSFSNLFAQKISLKNNDCFIEGNFRSGFVLPHPDKTWLGGISDANDYTRDNIKNFIWFGSGELRFGYQTKGKNKWEKQANYPILGVTLRYTNYNNLYNKEKRNQIYTSDNGNWSGTTANILGQNIAFFGYVQVPIIRFKYFSWHMQLGMGAGVMTRPFDPIVNPENVLISLYVTPYINIQTGIDVKVTPQFDITLNGSFMHSSNAATNMPNYGINEATALLGLRLHFNKSANLPSMWKKHQDTLAKFQPVNSLFFTVEPFFLWARYDDYYYFKTIAQIGYMRHALSILSFGASLDFTLANRLTPSRDVEQMQKTPGVINDLELAARRDRVEYTDMPKNIATVGAYAFGEINFGRFIFHVGLGGYIYKGGGPNDGPGHWFNMHRQIELDDNDMPVAGTGSGSIAGDFDLSEASRWSENGGTLHKNPWMFEKVGFRIELGKKRNHFVGAYIRAHAPVADYLCFQYGYKFVNFKDVKKK